MVSENESNALLDVRAALHYREQFTKAALMALNPTSLNPTSPHAARMSLRARRAAYREAIALVDEALATGGVRNAATGGPDDGLVDALRNVTP